MTASVERGNALLPAGPREHPLSLRQTQYPLSRTIHHINWCGRELLVVETQQPRKNNLVGRFNAPGFAAKCERNATFECPLYIVIEGIGFIAETCFSQKPAQAGHDEHLAEKRRASGTAAASSKRKVIAQGNLAR